MLEEGAGATAGDGEDRADDALANDRRVVMRRTGRPSSFSCLAAKFVARSVGDEAEADAEAAATALLLPPRPPAPAATVAAIVRRVVAGAGEGREGEDDSSERTDESLEAEPLRARFREGVLGAVPLPLPDASMAAERADTLRDERWGRFLEGVSAP